MSDTYDTPRRTGRPSKLTPDLQDKMVEAILAGSFRGTAAAWCGIGRRTFVRWMRRGKAGPDGPYGGFRRAVIEAESHAENRAVGVIIQAGTTDPKHLMWWLERKFPDRWGRDSYRLRELERQLSELEKLMRRLPR